MSIFGSRTIEVNNNPAATPGLPAGQGLQPPTNQLPRMQQQPLVLPPNWQTAGLSLDQTRVPKVQRLTGALAQNLPNPNKPLATTLPQITPTPAATPLPAFNMTPRQQSKLVATLVSEAGGEGQEGMQAVLNSIVNRTTVNPSYYGKTVWDVISKPQQYTGFSVRDPNYKQTLDYLDKKVQVAPDRKAQIQQAQALIQQAMIGKLQDLSKGATHYYNPEKAAHQSWMDVGEQRATVGQHKFIYLKR